MTRTLTRGHLTRVAIEHGWSVATNYNIDVMTRA